jgi:hypothetical protein
MSTFLFSLLFISSGVPSIQYMDLTFGQCIDRMIKEQDAIDLLSHRYPDLDLRVQCVRQER